MQNLIDLATQLSLYSGLPASPTAANRLRIDFALLLAIVSDLRYLGFTVERRKDTA